ILLSSDKAFKYGSASALPQDELNRIREFVKKESGGTKGVKFFSFSMRLNQQNTVIYANNIPSALTGENLGVMITVLDERYLFQSYQDVKIAEGSKCYIVDQGGKVISSLRTDEIGSQPPDKQALARIISSAKAKKSFHYGQNLVTTKVLKPTGWILVTEIPYSYLYHETNTIQSYIILFVAIGVLLSLAAAYVISRSISVPIKKLVASMKRAKEGDLTLSVEDGNRDEVSVLFESLNQMLANIRHLVQKVHSSAAEVIGGAAMVSESASHSHQFSQQMNEAIRQIAEGSTAQAAHTVESVHHMGQLSKDILDAGDIAGGVSQAVDKARALGEQIQGDIGLLNQKALETSRVSEKVVGDIVELNGNLQEISKITKMISQVAEQTNLLSLNASIEAARAGEAGKGFAVVAGEVKKLSDQTKGASQAISQLIDNLLRKSENTAMEARASIDIVNDQTQAVKAAKGSFIEIFEAMDNTGRLMMAMVKCMDKMVISKEEVSFAMESISSVSEEFAATAEQVAASTEEQMTASQRLSELASSINTLASELNHLILAFKF
ncbi:MAG: methyl-accepting chemotaxis protein, partial [Clostridia bacterium]|nr:methyl-accepting chemotaxis protein [Clostridia bacterium]